MHFDWDGSHVEHQAKTEVTIAREMRPEIVNLLSEFERLFREPHGLPLIKAKDHAIRLYDGVQPPNLRPYRYPYYQKNEIEKIVQEMLSVGVIHLSVSLFSSAIILVEKKKRLAILC